MDNISIYLSLFPFLFLIGLGFGLLHTIPPNTYPFLTHRMLRGYISFFTGIVTAFCYIKTQKIHHIIFLCFLCFTILTLKQRIFFMNFRDNMTFIYTPLLLFLDIKGICIFNKLCSYLGKISFGIFVWQYLLLCSLSMFGFRIAEKGDLKSVSLLLILLIMLSMMSYHFIEKKLYLKTDELIKNIRNNNE